MIENKKLVTHKQSMAPFCAKAEYQAMKKITNELTGTFVISAAGLCTSAQIIQQLRMFLC